ncbi:MAG: DUF1326 domain-containing protein [Planctomycetes bacterium]|nr:DUF1326 domain-containing protein [Planctomycetota bacterium]
MLPIVVLLAIPSVVPVPSGHYVESRTAAVFAGACHYNGEYCTDGREALCVWHFDAGRFAGADLAGVDVALSLRGDDNLAAKGVHVARSVYLSSRASTEQREAALALLRAREPALFAGARVLDALPIQASFGADGSYSVEGGRLFALSGSTLEDRACCKMPFNVWYEPFARIDGRVVGDNDVFRMSDTRLGGVFDRPGSNAAFTGSFRYAD